MVNDKGKTEHVKWFKGIETRNGKTYIVWERITWEEHERRMAERREVSVNKESSNIGVSRSR